MPPLMQLPAYQTPNALLNFAPVSDGIDSYRKGQEDVRRFGVAQQAGNALMGGDYKGAMSSAVRGGMPELANIAMQAQNNASQQETAALAREHQMAQMYGGVAQQVLALQQKGDAAGAQALYGRIAANPNMAAGLAKHGIDPKDHVGASQFLMAQAAGYKDPLAQEATRAQIGLSGAHAELFRAQAANAKNGGDVPMHIKEWQQFQKMAPDQQSQYLLMKRAAEKPLDTGTSFVRPDALNPNLPPAVVVQKDVAGKEYEQEVGTAKGKAAAALPTVVSSANRLLNSIDAVVNDPNLSKVTGIVGGRIPKQFQTEGMAETQSKLDQVAGQAFLQAYNDLRGAGAITEKEGEKAEAAYSRLRTQTMGTDAYKAAAREFRNEILKMTAIAKERAARPPAAGSMPAPAAPTAPAGWSIEKVQ